MRASFSRDDLLWNISASINRPIEPCPRWLVVASSGNEQSALLQSAAIRGPLPMLNVRGGIRGRGLMPASSSCTTATATAMQMRQIPRDHHIMNPLCATNTGRRVSPPFFSSQSFPSAASRCAHCSLECRRPSPFLLFPSASTRCRSLAASSTAKRHLMKCHRCPTDCRVKCRRLLIPRLFLQRRSRGISTLRDGMRRGCAADDKIAPVGGGRENSRFLARQRSA